MRNFIYPSLGAGCILRRMYKKKLQLCTGLQSRKAVSIIKEHQVTVSIFTGRYLSLGYAECAKRELCC
jgi:hypothetical protein